MNQKPYLFWWIGSVGIGLLILIGITFVFFLVSSGSSTTPKSSNPSQTVVQQVLTEPAALNEVAQVVESEWPTLPPMEFPPGSVEEACEFNTFPPYHYREEDGSIPINSPFERVEQWVKRGWKPLELAECREALEKHIYEINPYLWGETVESQQFGFIVVEEPLTFERIFTDPIGDLHRVQDALSRSECLLVEEETNWHLRHSCHADAFLNFALINRFCYDSPTGQEVHYSFPDYPKDGVAFRKRSVYGSSLYGTKYWEEEVLDEDLPTLEQDRFMWKQALEDAWVRMKCKDLDPELEFTPERYPELYEVVKSLGELGNFRELMIELAARLGDDAAGLTVPVYNEPSHNYHEAGYEYGRYRGFFSHRKWRELEFKEQPSEERFYQVFSFLASLRETPGFKFSWDWVATYLCSPPYQELDESRRFTRILEDGDREFKSCHSAITELQLREDLRDSVIEVMDIFTSKAVELEVYY